MFMHVYESIFLLDNGTAQNHQHLLANGAEADRNGQLDSTGRLREYRATPVSLFVRGKTAPLERIYIVSIFTMGEPEGSTAVWVRSLSADPSKRFARIARASNRRANLARTFSIGVSSRLTVISPTRRRVMISPVTLAFRPPERDP